MEPMHLKNHLPNPVLLGIPQPLPTLFIPATAVSKASITLHADRGSDPGRNSAAEWKSKFLSIPSRLDSGRQRGVESQPVRFTLAHHTAFCYSTYAFLPLQRMAGGRGPACRGKTLLKSGETLLSVLIFPGQPPRPRELK